MSFCAAPFVHMVQNPDGQYRTCCMYEKPLSGKYKNIKEAFDSEENDIIRKRMLSGERLEECKKCDIDEMHNAKKQLSYRKEFNRKYKDYIDYPRFKTLEISVSNKCNFKCIDCGPRFSNQFGKTIENDLPSAEDFHDIDFLKILGGEPFLDKRNIELFKIIPRKNIELMLVTNNSIFPKDDVLELLLDFKKINITISIDGKEDVAEFVRFGTKWKKFERNWIKWHLWSEKHEQINIIPHFVFHSLNAPFFEETFNWSNLELNSWSWDILISPEWLNISFLPNHIKEYILDKNIILHEPLKKFLTFDNYNEKIFHRLLKNLEFVPTGMEEYIDLFFRKR